MRIGGSSGESVGEKPPPGTYPAILVGVWDLGIQPGWGDKPAAQKVALAWETVKRNTKGAPFVIYEALKASSYHLAPVAKRFVALAGRAVTTEEEDKGFDLDPYVGKAVLLNVVPPGEDGGWPKIEAAMPLPEGMPVPVKIGDYSQTPKFVTKMLERRVAKAGAAAEAQPWGDGPAPF